MDEENFEKWNKQKQEIYKSGKYIHYKEGEIRWVYMGQNIKSEIVGKGDGFSRPVLVFKKVYGHSCIAIPLTSQDKIGSYHYTFDGASRKKYCAVFTQIRYIDGTRIREKIDYVSLNKFKEIESAFIEFIKK